VLRLLRALRSHPLAQLVVIAVIGAVIGVLLALSIHWFPPRASTQARSVDHLYNIMLIVSVPIFVVVETVVIFSVWKFRMRPGQENQDGPPIHGNTTIEVVWTALPAVLLVSLCTYSYIVLHRDERKRPGEMVVNVTGQQFAWSFAYPQPAGTPPVRSFELYLPVNRPVRFEIQSKDVIHAFWIPAFRLQEDAVPGITTSYRVTPTRRGAYPIVCAELCGLGHTTMRTLVHVVTPQQFAGWMAQQKAPAAPAAGQTPADVGKQLFTSSTLGCGGCHTIADAGTTGAVGPRLDQVLKGSMHSAAFIRRQILTGGSAYLVPGYPANVMPKNFGSVLTPQQLDALVSYLQKVSR
jgi:cytochrome c oxidase subunit 2